MNLATLTDAEILAARPARNNVDPQRPYAFLVEPERSPQGRIDDVATIFPKHSTSKSASVIRSSPSITI